MTFSSMHWFCVAENLIPSRIGYWIPSSTPQWCQKSPPVDAVRCCQVGSFPKPIPCKGRMTDAMMHRLIRENRHPGTMDLEREGIVNSEMFLKLYLAKGYGRICRKIFWPTCRKWRRAAKKTKLQLMALSCSCAAAASVWIRHPNADMAAAQNVRSGSSPGPTNDPDLWSRPPIQTFPRELIQTLCAYIHDKSFNSERHCHCRDRLSTAYS